MSTKKCKALCRGCRNDFYNGNNDMGVKECWSFKGAKVAKRWRIGWWTSMDRPENFHEVTTLDCFHQTGTAAYLKELPEHIRAMMRRKPKKVARRVPRGTAEVET